MTETQGFLFDPDSTPCRPLPLELNMLKKRVWTASKAQLIQRYLQLFVWVTKNAIYLDAFAGPQNEEHETSWAAKRVLEVTPKWAFRRFVLCELDPAGVDRLRVLERIEKTGDARKVIVLPGDSNIKLLGHLATDPIKDNEAAFCLLDQRTHECDWATVKGIATHKKGGHKIEIFYFLGISWSERAVAALNSPEEVMTKWWGRGDWKNFMDAGRQDRALILAGRFKEELGYKHAYHYPIFKDADSSLVMFYMIHATDHDAAPELMVRAYNGIRALGEIVTQEEMEWAKDHFARISAVAEISSKGTSAQQIS